MSEEYSSLMKRQLKRTKIDLAEFESIGKDAFLDFVHRVELTYAEFKEKNAQLLLAAEQSSNEIRAYIEKLKVAQELSRKRQADIESMLENLQQGVFTVAEDGTVQGEYSSYLTQILETEDISQKNIVDLILLPSRLDQDMCDQILAAISCSVGTPFFNFEVNQHLLPAQIQFSAPKGDVKEIDLEWIPILNSEERVEKIMITARDLTQINLLQKQHAAQTLELGMIHELLSLDQKKFFRFISTSFEYVDSIAVILDDRELIHVDQAKVIYRYLHTIKGNARTYGLSAVTSLVHETEAVYREAVTKGEALVAMDRQRELNEISRTLTEYRKVAVEKLRFDSENHLRVDSRFADAIAEIVGLFQEGKLADRDALKQIRRHVEQQSYVELKEVLDDIETSLPSIAEQVGKATPLLKIEAHGWHVAREIEGALRDILTHVLRNAIDHGIETPLERRNSNKLEHGVITIELLQDGAQMRLSIADDGRGLQLKAIVQRALDLGLISLEELTRMSAIEKANLIFYSGLSTCESRSTISGAGVGMDAIQAFVEELGGEIEIYFEEPKKTSGYDSAEAIDFTFHIRLPMRYFISTHDDSPKHGALHTVA